MSVLNIRGNYEVEIPDNRASSVSKLAVTTTLDLFGDSVEPPEPVRAGEAIEKTGDGSRTFLGIFDSISDRRTSIPDGFESRSAARRYVDIYSLKPMLAIIDRVRFATYHAIIRGKAAEYVDIAEARRWGQANGYDFCHESEISKEWREYVRTIERVHMDVARLQHLGQQMEFDDDESSAVPSIDWKTWPCRAQSMVVRVPASVADDEKEFEHKVPLSIYESLATKYRVLRKTVASKAKNERPSAFRILQLGDHFAVRFRRRIAGQAVAIYRSFENEPEAIEWATELADELAVLDMLGPQALNGVVSGARSLSELLANSKPDPTGQHETPRAKAVEGQDRQTPPLSALFELEAKYERLRYNASRLSRHFESAQLNLGSEKLVRLLKTMTESGRSIAGDDILPEAIFSDSVSYQETKVCGVYFLLSESCPAGSIQYIGQSKDVLKRTREHEAAGEIKFQRVSVIEVEASRLTEVESWYIRKYQPPFNRSGVPGKRRKKVSSEETPVANPVARRRGRPRLQP